MQINQNIIDEVIRRSDIVEIIGKNLKLKRSGANYFACCPFHKEKSPSFSINSSKQFFHCFGCGESGNVIGFTMKYNGLDFVDAVKSLAHNCGVYIPETTIQFSKEQIKQQKAQKNSLSEVINKAVTFYQRNLQTSNLAKHYLSGRGLSDAIINQFSLGYVPEKFSALACEFEDYATNQYLLDAGLVMKNENGKLYDRFRDRVIFPIRNTKGDVIAFGGRIIAQGEPKYLNSPETTLFNKSHELYGLFEAQRAIRDTNYAIVVEGYMDVIALVQFGVNNVVATMGTAVTEEHIKKLLRLCDDIYYCFDGDKAGQKAAWRALERSLALVSDSKAVHFLFLPNQHDPDSFIREKSVGAFDQLRQNNSLSLTGFLLKQLCSEVNLATDEGKAKLISLAKPYVDQVKALALQVMLKKQLANLVELEPNVLESILNNRSRYAFYNGKWKSNQIFIRQKTNITMLNNIEVIVSHALKHIDWVTNYKLPDEIACYTRDVQELTLLLDFINHNYDTNDKIELVDILDSIEFRQLNIQHIFNKEIVIQFDEPEFRLALDRIFGFSKHKAIRVPKIPMRSNLNE